MCVVIWQWDQIEGKGEESEYEHTCTHVVLVTCKLTQNSLLLRRLKIVLTFKCIGTTKEHRYMYQEIHVLAEADLNRQNGMSVAFRTSPEFNNAFDARAIAFQCCLKNKWERVGSGGGVVGVQRCTQGSAVIITSGHGPSYTPYIVFPIMKHICNPLALVRCYGLCPLIIMTVPYVHCFSQCWILAAWVTGFYSLHVALIRPNGLKPFGREACRLL